MESNIDVQGSDAQGTETMTRPTVNGLILAGGYSTRMGTDKSLLVYHGAPQREFLFHVLAKICASVFTSCRKDQNVPLELNPIRDCFSIPGPLNGILSAFAFRNDVAWLAVAVDMPFVNTEAVETLLRHRDRSCVATCYFNRETQRPEPLLTLWESRAHPLLLRFIETGNVSPREFLQTHRVHMIYPPDEKTLVNINYPGDVSSV